MLESEKEELRFERDRYKASASKLQQQLSAALADGETYRAGCDEAERLREQVDYFRRELVKIARDFENKLAQEKLRMQTEMKSSEEYNNRRFEETRVSLEREFENRLSSAREMSEGVGRKKGRWLR